MLLVDHQRSEAWLSARLNRITASLAPACLGLDPYCSARKAWRSILGLDNYPNRVPNWHMRRGILFEASARLEYEAFTGNMIEETGFWVHPVLDWLGASPDGLIGTEGLLECKCPMDRRNGLPIHHRLQMLAQLFVCQRRWCDYWSWPAPPQKPFLARVTMPPGGIPVLIRRLADFYRNFVISGIEPPRKARKR